MQRTLDERTAGPPVPAFWFHLSSPFTYLRAEEADRMLAGLRWMPARDPRPSAREDAEGAEREAAARGLPLVWPDDTSVRPMARAMRVAALASARGRGALFVLAATRLAYCGGYDLDDVDVLMQAGATAGMDARECARVAESERHDAALDRAEAELGRCGIADLPAVELDGRFFFGPDQVAAAAAWQRVRPAVVEHEPVSLRLAARQAPSVARIGV